MNHTTRLQLYPYATFRVLLFSLNNLVYAQEMMCHRFHVTGFPLADEPVFHWRPALLQAPVGPSFQLGIHGALPSPNTSARVGISIFPDSAIACTNARRSDGRLAVIIY